MLHNPKSPDWEAIEREYRAGQVSVREIGRQHGVTDTAIRKRAKQENWSRDLTEEVRRAVRNEAVRSAVRTELSREPVSDKEIVETHAKRGAKAIEGHLTRADRLKGIADGLMDQLETYMRGGNPSVTIFVSKSDSPSTILRTLAATVESIAKIERQALNIDDQPERPGETIARIERRIIDPTDRDA